MLEGKNVFVTGGYGFVGSHLVNALVDEGANVYLLNHDELIEAPFKYLGKKGKVIRGSVLDGDILNRVMTRYKIDYVFHLAAQPLVEVALKDPVTTLNTNIMGTVNVLEAARLQSVKGVVIASSDKAYGEGIIPYVETQALRGAAPYDVSKSCADLIAQAYYKTYGLPIVITRCANIYGPGDTNMDRLIPTLMNSVIMKKNVVLRSDGNFIRDFMYVTDAVAAYILCAEKIDSVKGMAFNFGCDEKHKVIDVVKEVLNMFSNNELGIEFTGEAKSEIKDQYLDSSLARKTLGWKPKFSLKQGIKETYEWYSKWLN